MRRSPLYQDTFALCAMLLAECGGAEAEWPPCRRLTSGALRLLDQVSLAVHGFHRGEHLEAADMELCTLRSHLELAAEMGVVEEDVFLDLAEQMDLIGRQIGGWRKKLAG